jgi:hypothetical protein
MDSRPWPWVNTDGIAEYIELLCESDSAGGDSANGFAGRSALVNAAVVFTSRFPVVKAFDPKGDVMATGNRRGEWILPRASTRNFFL